MIDIVREIEAVHRDVRTAQTAGGQGRAVVLRRSFDAPIDDVWDAVTTAERIGRWFLPISGELRLGGHYQLEGNAGGEVVACDPPNRFRVTWVMGVPATPADVSELEVRLTRAGDATELELEHIAMVPDEMWTEYGPGAVGVGWDQALLGLSLYLRTGRTVDDPIAWQLSDEGRDYATRSSAAWGAANEAAGTDPADAARAVLNTTAFYTTAPEAPPSDAE